MGYLIYNYRGEIFTLLVPVYKGTSELIILEPKFRFFRSLSLIYYSGSVDNFPSPYYLEGPSLLSDTLPRFLPFLVDNLRYIKII